MITTKTQTILSEEASNSLKSILSENTTTVCLTSKEERMNRLLLNYPVRPTWVRVYDQLERVYNERVRLWSSVGAYEGLIVSTPCVLDKAMCECLVNIPDNLLDYFSLQISRDIRKPITEASRSWRLSFAAGAIIGASMHDQNLYRGSCACFGYDCEYEGTAGQMAFDPNLAVLERVKYNPHTNSYDRVDGFQFVVLTPIGIHAYGGLYTGNKIEDRKKSSALAYELGSKLRGNAIGCDYPELNNKALDKIAYLIKRTSDTTVDPQTMYVENTKNTTGKPVAKKFGCANAVISKNNPELPWLNERLIEGADMWQPMEVQNSYCERVYEGAYWPTNCELVNIFDEYEINDMLDTVEIYDNRDICEWCEEPYNSEYDGVYSEILEQSFCCWDCWNNAIDSACTQRIGDIVLINGEMYDLNEIQ